jgi:hypothetical protein
VLRNKPTSKCVHAEVSELEVNQAIIRTYLTTRDIVRLAELRGARCGQKPRVEKNSPTCMVGPFEQEAGDQRPNACQYLANAPNEGTGVARVEIGGRRQGQEVWARWIDGRVQGDREFLKVAGLDPGTRFEDPHAFVELIQGLLDKGSANVALDVPPRPA